MSVPNRQIGWGNESNLLWQLSKQLDTLTNVTSTNLNAIIANLATKVTNQLGTPSFRSDTLANLPAAGETGRMFVSTDTFAFYRDNGTGWDLIGGPGIGTVTGSGTTNYLSKWTGSSALGNSLVFDNGSQVGVNTSSIGAGYLLGINGRVTITNMSNSPSLYWTGNNNGLSNVYFENLSTGGNAGVGTRYANDTGLRVQAYLTGSGNTAAGANTFTFDCLSTTRLEFTSRGSNIDFNTVSIGVSNTKLRIFNNGNIGIATNPVDAGYKLDVNGTVRVQGTELRLDNGTTGTLNIYSATPTINFFSGGGYTFGRSATTMTWNSGGTIAMQISGNNGYSLDASNGHVWKTALSGGSNLARLTTGGNLMVGTTTDVASAILQLSSTTKGFLPPVMTGAQAEAIATPATGLMVYANNGNGATITSTGWWGYNGTTWVKLN